MNDRPPADDRQPAAENHISVCICTFKRPQMLSNLISKLQNQFTENLFTYSAVIVDNDSNRSAAAMVRDWQTKSCIRIDYYFEPEQNIALARNKAVENAKGNWIAFIDDDEFPEPTWLLNLYKTIRHFKADAVLGPVRPHYPDHAPEWLIKSNLCERPSHKTGTILQGKDTRTGNVLLDRGMFASDRFDRAFGRTGGEDIQFFRTMESKGKVYVWCEEAPAYETVPPERWSAQFYTRRSLRIGGLAGRRIRRRNSLYQSVYFSIKSTVYLTVLALSLPVSWLAGKHLYMRVLTKLVYHYSLMSSLLGRPIILDREDGQELPENG